jgi:transmembrane sensor
MSRFNELWEGYLTDKLSNEEIKELLGLMQSEDQTLLTSIEALLEDNSYKNLAVENREEVIFQKVLQRGEEARSAGRIIFWRRLVAAAAVLFIISMGTFYLLRDNKKTELALETKQTEKPESIEPGGDRAVLTLADGTQIILDTAGNGSLAEEGGIKVIKIDGQLTYSGEANPSEVLYNTVSTPRGGQYQLVLEDGSRVWLNAASSLRFPSAFSGKERIVELKGEGYFEVAPNSKMPFYVRVNDMTVEVVGTHFNINSYSDEPEIRTTLLEGKVKVQNGGSNVSLQPGQQAIMRHDQEKLVIIDDVDLEQVVAWKNGKFLFKSTDLDNVMRQLSRWYDVDIIYEKKINETISGGLPRSQDINQLLKIMESTGKVAFEIKGKQIIVRPKQ